MAYAKIATSVFLVGFWLIGVVHSFTRYSEMLPSILFVDLAAAVIYSLLLAHVWRLQ